MRRPFRLVTALAAVAALAFPLAANAGHTTDPGTANMIKLGHNVEVPVSGGAIHSDIAFWRNYAFEGSYDGFRILDIGDPNNPTEVSDTLCGASQGDMTISPDGNILVRSQDSARILPGNNIANACNPGTAAPGGAPVGQRTVDLGWEGLQIFDVSNKANPVFIKAVATDCGSHTHTQVHDPANNRLIIYVSRSGGGNSVTTPYGTTCTPTMPRITAVSIPLDNPSAAAVVNNNIPAGNNGCHDVSVFEGRDLLYGACRPYMILWDISDPVNPRQLHAVTHPGVTPTLGTSGWHSAGFSWDGEYLIAGWEPGGGVLPRCQATGAPLSSTDPTQVQTDEMKSVFFFRASDGAFVNKWVLPRPQTNQEACTIHNYNTIPSLDRHLLAMGNYTAGTSVLDFTDVMNPRELGYVDPLPVDLNKGGAWSSHWYNRILLESDIDEGLNIFRLDAPFTSRTLLLPYLNPQTMGEPFECSGVATSRRLVAGRAATVTARLRVDAGYEAATIRQPAQRVRVRVSGAGIRARQGRTDAQGMIRFTVRPSRAGTLRVVAPGELNMEGCAASLRVNRAPRRGGAGGPVLTGRMAVRIG